MTSLLRYYEWLDFQESGRGGAEEGRAKDGRCSKQIEMAG